MQLTVKYACKIFITSAMFFICCNSNENVDQQNDSVKPRTPVTFTTIQYGPLEEFTELNATATYLQKSYVKANLIGYIRSVNIHFGSFVSPGQALFSLQTKESRALGNTINKLDPTFKFTGINYVKSAATGYVTELNHQVGDYIQDGEQLAVISVIKSFVFVMEMPYEYKVYVLKNKRVQLTLPGGERVEGMIQNFMPFVDSASQTQAVTIKIHDNITIPAGLVARVKIIKVSKAGTATLPKDAVLSDETESDFWVMKMVNDSTAVKVPVTRGVTTAGEVEILAPQFSLKDKILITGNFGLPDTAFVTLPSPSAKGN